MIVSRPAAFALVSVLGLAAAQDAPSPAANPGDEEWNARSMYTIDVKSLEGEPMKLSKYEGKVALVVNLASRCGYTPQYEGLEKLYNEFKERGLVILGFPCNDFGGQEPGTPQEIREFCTSTYQVTFPLFEKVHVTPGEDQSVVYTALQAKTGNLPRWNFGKYLIDRNGTKAEFVDSKVTPESKELREALQRALAAK